MVDYLAVEKPAQSGTANSREGVHAGAHRSEWRRLHNVGQITRRLSDVDVVHEGAKLVGDSVTNW